MTERSGGLPWLLHDVLLGVFGGGAIGIIVGVFAFQDADRWVPWTTGAVLAVLSVAALRARRSRHPTGPGALGVALWILGGLAILFIATIIYAISQFE